MTRKVIKSFRDLQDGGKMYAPNSRRFNTYTGDREEELFKLGYLGEVVVDEEVTEVEVTEEVTLTELSKDQLKAMLDEQNIEYTERNTKIELIDLLMG